MKTTLLRLMSLLAVCSSLVFAQSGAPNLVQYYGRLVDLSSQPITTPTQVRVQIIQGGTAEENPSTGRVVFIEQAEVTPDADGYFSYLIGSHAPNVGTGRVQLDAEDFNTTRPVFVEIAMVGPNSSVHVLLPRQRLSSVPFALQAADAAVDERLVNTDGDTMTGPLQIQASLQVGSGGPALGKGDAFISGLLQVGPNSLVLNGNGIRFPDGTFQTGAGLPSVMHDATLMGTGTNGSPLGVATGGIDTNQLAAQAVTGAKIAPGAIGTAHLYNDAVTGAKIAPGQVVKSLNSLFDNVTLQAGSNISITPAGNMLTVAAPNALASVSHNSTLTGNGASGSPLGVAVPLSLSGSTVYEIGVIDVSNSGYGSAVRGTSSNSIGAGVWGRHTDGDGVRGNSPQGVGVRGSSSSGDGVWGYGSSGVGVRGTTQSGVGVRGSSSSGDGVRGESDNGVGVLGNSYTSTAIRAEARLGHLIEGVNTITGDVKFRVENDGDVRADGTFASPAADFAEMMEVEGSGHWKLESYQPGDVLIISPGTGKLTKGQRPYCPLVAGVYSTKPAFLGGHEMDKERPGQVPLAILGIVPTNVSAENGPIAIGDLLVTSSTPGHAMKGTDRSQMLGAIVGKALEPLPSGAGTIKVLVTLQ